MFYVQTGENKQVQQQTQMQFLFPFNRASKQPTDVNCMGVGRREPFYYPEKGEIVALTTSLHVNMYTLSGTGNRHMKKQPKQFCANFPGKRLCASCLTRKVLCFADTQKILTCKCLFN